VKPMPGTTGHWHRKTITAIATIGQQSQFFQSSLFAERRASDDGSLAARIATTDSLPDCNRFVGCDARQAPQAQQCDDSESRHMTSDSIRGLVIPAGKHAAITL